MKPEDTIACPTCKAPIGTSCISWSGKKEGCKERRETKDSMVENRIRELEGDINRAEQLVSLAFAGYLKVVNESKAIIQKASKELNSIRNELNKE